MAAIVTGRHADTTGHFGTHVLDPHGSPFRWLRAFGHGRALVRPRHRFLPVRRSVRRVSRWLSGAHDPDPGWVPLRFLPQLRPLEGLRPLDAPRGFGAPGLFDVARQRGIRHRVLDSLLRADDEGISSVLVRALRARAPYGLYLARLRQVKEGGEAYGPDSDAVQRVILRETDERLASVHAALAAQFSAWDLVVIGEHGMAEASRVVDPYAPLAHCGARPGKDFVTVVHSSLAAFWCLNERGESALQDALARLPGASLVDESARRALHIPAGRRAGDLLLAARPGVVFWRDHYHAPGAPSRGAFGYLEKEPEGAGALVVASSAPDVGPTAVGHRHLVDVFPTMCGLLGAPVPDGVEGRSLLDGSRETTTAHPLTPYARIRPQVVPDV